MYRDNGLVIEAERYRTGANTHWLTSTLHMYFNSGSVKYKHLFTADKQEKYEQQLRNFVNAKGVQRELTPAEVDAVYKKLGWKR